MNYKLVPEFIIDNKQIHVSIHGDVMFVFLRHVYVTIRRVNDIDDTVLTVLSLTELTRYLKLNNKISLLWDQTFNVTALLWFNVLNIYSMRHRSRKVRLLITATIWYSNMTLEPPVSNPFFTAQFYANRYIVMILNDDASLSPFTLIIWHSFSAVTPHWTQMCNE